MFLMDGVANGRIRVQIQNWNGQAYKIPRDLLSECKDLDVFKQSGVYFLLGYRSVYVGQAEVRKNGKGILQRIIDHTSDRLKDEWDEVVVITTKDNSFGRTDISYLENSFYNKAVSTGRYEVQNNNEPSIGTVTDEKEAELEEFMDYAELILGALGYKAFEPVQTRVRSNKKRAASEEKKKVGSCAIPALPDRSLKIGEFVRTAMRNLSQSGYRFDASLLREMYTPEWSLEHFHTNKPFLKEYIEGKTDNKGADGKNVRFWSEVFIFGNTSVLVSKEWYDRQYALFIKWYSSLI